MNVDVLREREVLFSAPCRELTDKVKKIFWLHSYDERGVNRERICTGGPRTIEDEDVSDSTDDKYAPGGALRARLADDHMAPPFSARACCSLAAHAITESSPVSFPRLGIPLGRACKRLSELTQ